MFTGLIEEVGTVTHLQHAEESVLLTISAGQVSAELAVGDSVSVNGVCLTATAVTSGRFTALAMLETVRRTTLGRCAPGSQVNLERALRLSDRLGGHLVLGHVDGVGRITGIGKEGAALRIDISAAADILQYIVPKGSIAVDGVSLTVADIAVAGFAVALIPHTQSATTLQHWRVGDDVNLETDIIGKYVARLLRVAQPTTSADTGNNGLSIEALQRFGFA